MTRHRHPRNETAMTPEPPVGTHMIPDAAPTHVALRDVRKEFTLGDGTKLAAADGITLDIERGRFTAVTGPSGSGKSTLLHLIGAIDHVDSGTITVGDTDITALTSRAAADYRAGIGFIFQRFHLLPALTLTDNVLAPVIARKVDFDKRARARELLDAVGLEGRYDSMPSQLSGGQQQRVAIARALVSHPDLLLADEPTGALDSTTADEILTLLRDLQTTRGMTIIMATHDHTIAASAHREIHVRDGRLAEHG